MPEPIHDPCPTPMALDRFVTGTGDDADIERHLTSCPDCRALASEMRANNELANQLRDGIGAPSDASRLPRIEGYDLDTEIERGGQGVVYRAVQQSTRRTVALKLLLAGGFATSRQRRRFEREVELIAGLDHPNLVTIHDSGVTSDGQLFYAMQFIDGEPIDAYLDRRAVPLDLDVLLELFIAICDGVSYAHQHGVIHRDLKPANILVDGAGRPHVLDFGLAKLVEVDPEPGAPSLSMSGCFMGTVAYASPEQATGELRHVDARSDVYALGVILHEMLTGELPYDVSGDLKRTIDTITGAAPTPPSAVASPRVRIDRDLDTIVLKALAKEPDRRYQSVAALRDDVRRRQRGEPIDARRDSLGYLLRTTVNRNRLPFAAVGIALLVLVGFSIAMTVLYGRAAMEARKLRQTNLFLEDTLGSVEPRRPGEDVTVRELLDEAVPWIEVALSDEPEVAATIRHTVGASYRALGRHAEAEAQIQQSLAIRLELFGRVHPQVAQSLQLLALLRWDQERLDEAEVLLREALDIRARTVGKRTQAYSIGLANLGLLRLARADPDGAERLLREAMSIRIDVLGAEHADVAMCLFNLALVAEARGDTTAAFELHEHALDLRDRVLHPAHPDLGRSLEATGRLLLALDRPREAAARYERCLRLREAILSDDHALLAATRSALRAAVERAGGPDAR